MKGLYFMKRSCLIAALILSVTYLYSRSFFFVEPDDGKTWLLSEINRATNYIYITIYEMNDQDVLSALDMARKREVNIKVILNHFRDGRHNQVMADETNYLSKAGIGYRFADYKFPYTHEKCLLIDGKEAVICTFNLEGNYFERTRDFGVITTNVDDVREIKLIFDADWGFIHNYKINDRNLIWSPETARNKLSELINSAKTSLEIYNEELRDRDIINLISAAAGRGVKVSVICPVLKEGKKDSNIEGVNTLEAAGVMVKEVEESINDLYMHAKVIVADRKQAYVGSINFSRGSIDKNRELGIIVNDPVDIEKIESAFEKDWKL